MLAREGDEVRLSGPQGGDYVRLRAEWLRFKNHCVDADTELPTLAGVLDDARRLMEEGGRVVLLYMDLGSDGQFEVIHGWQAYDDVVRGFARALTSLRQDGLLGPSSVLAVMSVRSDKFLALLKRPEGDTLDPGSLGLGIRRALEDRLPRFLPPLFVAPYGFSQGHALVYRNPMVRAERQIHRALDEAMYMSLRQRGLDEGQRLRGLDEILRGDGIVTLAQPILDLANLEVVGHQVLSRGPAGSSLEDPERLFAFAERAGRLLELERLCRSRALRSVPSWAGRNTKIFLSTSVRALADPEVAGLGFIRDVDRQGLRHSDVVLEITERGPLEERPAYREALRSLKREGFCLAVDDMGAGYASLQSLVNLEPDYLKFAVSLVHHIDRSPIQRSLLETLVELSEKIGAKVIAEGIEAEAELTTLRDMGVPLGQGRYLAPPTLVPRESR